MRPPPARRGGAPDPQGPPAPPVVLLDCVTLWVTNLLFSGGAFGGSEPPEEGYNYDKDLLPPDEERAAAARVSAAVDGLVAAVAETGVTLVAVTNEVGLGVVPEYPLARLYRDQLGWANQRLARDADGLYLLVSGYPLDVKALAQPRIQSIDDPSSPSKELPVTDLLARTIAAIGPLDADAMRAAEARQLQLTKPPKALGRLETLSIQLAGIQGKEQPVIADKAIAVMAADHGVTAEGVSAFPAEVTPAMVFNMAAGGAGINVIGRHVGARVVVTDVGVNADLSAAQGVRQKKLRMGTANMAQGPAMTREEAVRAVEVGIELVEEELANGLDIIATGEVGIGNTTAASAVIAALTGQPAARVTGRGTGITKDALAGKVAVIEKALAANSPDAADPIDVLAKVGGLDIAAMTGVFLGGAAHRVPVVMDGFISAAAALAAVRLCHECVDYILPSHVSIEVGHQVVLEELGLVPLFDLQMRLGEGTGAALSMSIIEASARILSEMATFESAGVAGDPNEADADLTR